MISSFSSGPHAKKELLCLALESSSTIDLVIYNANLESLCTIENVAEFTILAGALSSCGSYVTILSGLPGIRSLTDFKRIIKKYFFLIFTFGKLFTMIYISQFVKIHFSRYKYFKAYETFNI